MFLSQNFPRCLYLVLAVAVSACVAFALISFNKGVYDRQANIPQKQVVPTVDDTPYALKPNSTFLFETTGPKKQKYAVKTNRRGIRSDRIEESRSDNATQIVLLGDSMTFGWGLNRSSRFSNICERDLRSDNHKINMVNAGMPGYGMEDYKDMLKERLIQRQPDMVFVVFTYSDIFSAETEDSSENNSSILSPYLRAVKKTLILRTTPISQSGLTGHMKDIAEISSRSEAETRFVSYWPLSNEKIDYLKTWAGARGNVEFISSPREFKQKGMRKFIISKEDPHLNSKANKKIASKLCGNIRQSLEAEQN